MSSTDQNTVSKRRVFYIPGYDPIHPRRYRELYRSEAAAQSAISGYEISQTARSGDDGFGWTVHATIDDQAVETEIDVLTWSDLVRDSMETSIPATYRQMVVTAWTYISTGALFQLMKLRKGPVIAALYPVATLILQALIAVFVAWVSYVGIVFAFSFVRDDSLAGLPLLHMIAAGGASIVIFGRVLRVFKYYDNKIFAYYLMHDYAHSSSLRGAYPPELETRLADFGDKIADALADDCDEVLVVGHSSGAHLAVSVLADLIRANRVPAAGPELGLLSLGQVVPMVSFLPDAHRLREDLHFLSTADELAWIDVTAPGDGCSFALCDPVAVSGVAPDTKAWPLVFSAAFTQTLSEERWSELRWRFFRLHFQYLCAFDRPKDYDYFKITAGPLTLRARYAGRVASKSRIDHTVSKYTSRRAA